MAHYRDWAQAKNDVLRSQNLLCDDQSCEQVVAWTDEDGQPKMLFSIRVRFTAAKHLWNIPVG
jgi:hypothetical protein